MNNQRGCEELEWHYLGAGELIVRIDGREIQEVTEHLGTDWEWDSVEIGVLTDEDGTVTEWATLMGAQRRQTPAALRAAKQEAA